MTTSELFKAHVMELQAKAEAGDEFANKSLACLSLLAEGWRYGDPDPTDPDDPGGGELIDLTAYRLKRAA